MCAIAKPFSSKFLRSSHRATYSAAAVIAAAGLPASADPAANDYCVEHTFDITTRGNLPPHLALKHREYAYARCGRAKDKVDNRAISVVGLGVSTFTATATAGTVSVANSETDVDTLIVGAASGEIRVFGDVDLCDVSVSRSAYGRAFSAARLYHRGQGMDRRGRIGWVGRWRAEPGIQGGVGKVRRIDPVIGRVFDRTTGIATEHLLIDIDNFVQGGVFAWENDEVTNSAPTMCFRMVMPGDVTSERGRLIVKAENGVITESIATGAFAGVAVPSIGASSDFSFDLDNETEIEYDMPGDDDHDLDIEIEMGGAGEHEEVAGALAGDVYITTDLDAGDDLSPVYQVPVDLPLGVPLIPGETSIAQPFVVLPGDEWTMGEMILRLVHPGATPDQPLEAAAVRIWAGEPGPTGRLIAGDLDTNRLLDTDFTGIYAVHQGNESSQQNPVVDAFVDLQWLPPLPEGRYHIEVVAQGSTPEPVMVPPIPFPATDDWEPALVGLGGSDYLPLIGHFGDPASTPILLLGDSLATEPCRADLDGDGSLTLFDFLAFQNLFDSGDLAADFDGDGELTIFDFLEFQNEFAAGCP
ncbi:MAG: hypothetical protein HRU13_04170 [Phycisphaerales bacterium]|nr:hypothetical protein [Phycisphaerales bacterium]